MNYTKSDEAIRKLTPEQYQVTQENGTEMPFSWVTRYCSGVSFRSASSDFV